MNLKRFILTFIAVFAAVFVSDWLVHSIWLKPAYEETIELWRPEPELLDRMGWALRAQLLSAAVLTTLWAVFAAPGTFGRALLFGLLVGLFRQAETLANYVVQPLPATLAMKWFFAGIGQSVLAGLILFAVYRPKAKEAPAPAKRFSPGWAAAALLFLLGLFGSALLFTGTRQQKIQITADWMKPLALKWITESAGKPHSIQSVSDITKSGHASLRFELRGGDVWTDPFRRSTFRAEVDTKDFPPIRSVRWYAFSLYLPEVFPKEDNWCVLAQWHGVDKRHLGEPNRIPVMAFVYDNGRLRVQLRHSPKRILEHEQDSTREVLFETDSFPLDQWNDFVVHAKWSCENDGFVNIWMNGHQIVKYTGPVGYNDNVGPYFRFGLYRGETAKTYVACFNQVRSGTAPEDIGFNVPPGDP